MMPFAANKEIFRPVNVMSLCGCSLQALTYLNLASNDLSGNLPSMWTSNGKWPTLSYMDLHSNLLSGTVPSTWSTWPQLQGVCVPISPLYGSAVWPLKRPIACSEGPCPHVHNSTCLLPHGV